MLKSIIVAFVLVASASTFAKGDRAAKDVEIKSACSAEIATSGCAGKDLGRGLLKCIHAYKKEHKDMVISESCQNARKELREKRQAKKLDMKPAQTK